MSVAKADGVWAVTSGEYSDYRVNAIFKDKRQARRWVAVQTDVPYTGFHVEFWTFGRVLSDLVAYNVRMYSTVSDVIVDYVGDEMREDLMQPVASFLRHRTHIGAYAFDTCVQARDPKHARKIATEIRTEILAGQRPFTCDGRTCLWVNGDPRFIVTEGDE